MPEKIIAAKLVIDPGNANSTLKGVNDNLNKVDDSLDKVKTNAASTGKAIETTGGSFGKLKDGLGAMPGPLGQASSGVTSLSSAFKAMLANPVVAILAAIVAVLALLYKAFTNTFEGGQKVEQVFAGIKAAGQSLLDNLDKIGSAIVKVFTLDFSGAIDEIKGVAKAATDAYGQMAKLTKTAQDLHKEQLANDLDQAKRFDRLAQLREKLADQDESPEEKKKAALELKKEAEINAKEDLDLAKRTAENKIAMLTLEKDGAKKNQDEINQIQIEQIKNATDNANELRRINKLIAVSDREIQTERREAAKKAAEEEKARRAQLIEFNNKLTGLQQENELALLTDSYQKELKVLENKIAAEKRINDLALRDGKINREQLIQLNATLDEQARIQAAAITDKHNKEVAKKEEDFQKELAKITGETRIKSITDTREAERVQLQIGYEEKLNDAIIRYKDDAAKLQEIRTALAEQQRVEDQKLADKFKAEDEKKKLAEMEVNAKKLIDNPEASLQAKQDILDAEQAAFQAAFDNKLLTEKDYTDKMKELSDARVQINEKEKEARISTVTAVGNAFGQLSDLVGKQTVAGKAFAVAQTTIATIQSAVSSFNSLSGIPIVGPALGAIAAAAAVASGIANVKKILSVKVPGQSGGGGSVPAISTPAAPIAPTQQSTKITDGSIQGIGASVGPARAFVVDSDIRNNNERQERLSRAARLGGE